MSLSKILSTSLLLALAVPTANAADKVTLTIAHANHPEAYREIAAEFTRQHPNIEVNLLPPANNYDELLQTVLRGNIVGDLPDVLFQSINRIDTLTERGLAQPLDRHIAELISDGDGWEAQGFSQTLIEPCEFNGATYCLPFAVSVPIIYYNPDLVTQAGGDPDNFPQTWDGIIELAERIDALSPTTLGLYFSYYQHSSNWTTTALITSQGGSLLSDDGKSIAFDGPEGREMLELMRRFGEAGQIDISLDQARAAFSAGTLGILSTSSSHLERLEQQTATQFELRTAPWPLDADVGRLPAGGNGIFILTDDPAKQEAAWEFIKFATGPVGQTIIVRHTGYTPVNTLALNDPDLLGGYFDENPNQRTAAEQAFNITRWQAFPGENGVRASDVFRDHIHSVVTLRRTPADVLPELVRDVTALLPH